VERTRSLHESVVFLTVEKESVPLVPNESRYHIADLGDGFFRLIISFGYMEEPNLLPILEIVTRVEQLPLDFQGATYYVGHETIVASDEGVIGRVPEAIFSYLSRNAAHEERRYGMPADQIVEIGAQIDL
jgi:KUP system potassium uptake protein